MARFNSFKAFEFNDPDEFGLLVMLDEKWVVEAGDVPNLLERVTLSLY